MAGLKTPNLKMSEEWGKTLKRFRVRTGLSQGEFSDAISTLPLEWSKAEEEALREIEFEHLVLANYELSRYENGRRLPRHRNRYLSLIWGLHKLGGILTIQEANEWLQQANQSLLTMPEQIALFGTKSLESGHQNALHRDFETDKPTVVWTSSSSTFKIISATALVLGVIALLFLARSVLLNFGANDPNAGQTTTVATPNDPTPTLVPTSIPTATATLTSTNQVDLQTGPKIKLPMPKSSVPVDSLFIEVDGESQKLTIFEEQIESIIPQNERILIDEVETGKNAGWFVFGTNNIQHRRGSRIGFAFDFEWITIPHDWAIFPYQSHVNDGYESPSFAFEKGKIGVRYGEAGSRGFDQDWYYTEDEGDPIAGRRYRVKGYYDEKPGGDASIEAWVQFSDNQGVTWGEWRQFAEAHAIQIGYTDEGVTGIYGVGGAYHGNASFQGAIYGWAFGHATADEAATDAFAE